jgi:hypothetical protein
MVKRPSWLAVHESHRVLVGVFGSLFRSLDPLLLQQLFNQGLMGVETPPMYEGGGGMSFVQSCIVIEELAKVDPAISVIVGQSSPHGRQACTTRGANARERPMWVSRGERARTRSRDCPGPSLTISRSLMTRLTWSPRFDHSFDTRTLDLTPVLASITVPLVRHPEHADQHVYHEVRFRCPQAALVA